MWPLMGKIPWNLQHSGVLSAWNPGIRSSFRPRMSEKTHIDLKKEKNAMEECLFLQDF